jgi:hypothetical protein
MTDTDRAAHQRFNELCKIVAGRGHGLTLAEIGDCWAVAQDEAEGLPDSDRARLCRARLGLDRETDGGSRFGDTLELPLDS